MRRTGTIIWYSHQRRIGTISDPDGKRYFFHQGCITRCPVGVALLDSAVTFVVDEEPGRDPAKLPVARQIEVIARTEPENQNTVAEALAKGVRQ